MQPKQIAEQDEKLKIKLETVFTKELTSLFNRINKENSQYILANGNHENAFRFKSDFESVLKKHYVRVQESFSGRVENSLSEEDQELSDKEQVLFNNSLTRWRDLKASDNAFLISETNNKNFNSSLQKAKDLLIAQEEPINNYNLAVGSATFFRRYYKPRAKNIAITETQKSAETTKIMEASVLSGLPPEKVLGLGSITLRTLTKKVWRTVGDSKVRSAHAFANGQRKILTDPFVVGGELLQAPGDTSLGATAWNIVGCRCSSTYEIVRVRI